MISFRDISIKKKLMFIIMGTCVFSLLLAGGAYVTYDVMIQREALLRNVAMLSQMIGANSTADLAFNDQRSAEENLAKLRVNPHIVASCIYNKDGEILASYVRGDMRGKLTLPVMQGEGYRFAGDHLGQFSRIYLDNREIGTVYVQFDLRELRSRVQRFVEIVFIIVVAASCVAYILSSRLQRLISDPISTLAETAKTISRDRDFSIRAVKVGGDEIGLLIDGFNEMLAQIQERDLKLAQYSEGLEELVARRTEELKRANEKLKAQMDENRKIEEELFKTRQLESLGILAGGIAHDFNNLLTAIMGNTSLAKMLVNNKEKAYTRLEEIERASVRARELTQQLLTFSKGGAPIKKVTSIADVIRETSRFCLSGARSRCELLIADDLWPVEVDEGQISQVINNLAINADQAMPEGGIINVSAINVRLCEGEIVTLPAGRYIRISVADHGTGIEEQYLGKIFAPYFTTKQKGSGLGLATSYSIIKKHNGLLTVESVIGSGTTFHIYLPASEKAPPELRNITAEVAVGGAGRVLVMDDEELIRATAGEMLTTLGYMVGFAEDGAEAIEMYRQAREAGEPYDVVVMDLTIPGGMGGQEAVQKLLEIDVSAKVIASSGYANLPIMGNFRSYGFCGVIAKPYSVEELSKVIKTVIA
jgi:signal transduction histidine kinase/CheY-like chemotaxis protein